MLTSYNLLRSRFRSSHQHWFCTIVALKPEPQPPPTTFAVTTTTTTSCSLPSRRFLCLGFDSRRHLHHSHHHSFHRSTFFSLLLLLIFTIIDSLTWFVIFSLLGFFTRAKPAQIIEFNDRHRFYFLFFCFWLISHYIVIIYSI